MGVGGGFGWVPVGRVDRLRTPSWRIKEGGERRGQRAKITFE